MTTCAPTDVALRIMPREMRMMTERVFSLSGQPKGFFLMVQDVVMYSQKLGLGGFALLEQRWESLKSADPSLARIARDHGDRLVLDGAGQHAWFVIPAVIDLLGELAARHGHGTVTVINAVDAAEHFGGGAAGEREQQNALGVDAGRYEVGDPMGERRRLARSCSSDNQQRRAAMRGGGPLLFVEFGKYEIDA